MLHRKANAKAERMHGTRLERSGCVEQSARRTRLRSPNQLTPPLPPPLLCPALPRVGPPVPSRQPVPELALCNHDAEPSFEQAHRFSHRVWPHVSYCETHDHDPLLGIELHMDVCDLLDLHEAGVDCVVAARPDPRRPLGTAAPAASPVKHDGNLYRNRGLACPAGLPEYGTESQLLQCRPGRNGCRRILLCFRDPSSRTGRGCRVTAVLRQSSHGRFLKTLAQGA